MMFTLVMEKVLFSKSFILQKMTEFKEVIRKGSKVENDISQTIENYNKESYATDSIIKQNAFIKNRVFQQARNIIGDTIEDLHLEIEQKNNKIELLENKKGPDSKVIEEMNKLGLNKISSKRKRDRIMDRLNDSLNKHKYIKNRKR